jgi:hypothetical protein
VWSMLTEAIKQGPTRKVKQANDRPVLLSEKASHPTSTSLQLSDRNKDLVLIPTWVLYTKTDWLTDCQL